jgi:hypothetical protein
MEAEKGDSGDSVARDIAGDAVRLIPRRSTGSATPICENATDPLGLEVA